MSKFSLTKKELINLYLNKNMSTREIAMTAGVTRSAILWRLKKWEIPVRGFYDPLVVKQRTAKIFNYSGLKRDKSPRWKGGKYKSKKGYIMILKPNYNGRKRRYVHEHTLIWEEINKKQLPNGWIIHHLNGVKDDNRPENLKAMSSSEHPKIFEIYQKRVQMLEKEIKSWEMKYLTLKKSLNLKE